LTIGVKLVPPIPPSDEMVNVPPCMSFGPSLTVARLRRDRHELAAQLDDALAVGVADHRHDQPARGLVGDADVVVALDDDRVLLGGQRAIELRVLFERRDDGLDQERQQRDPVGVAVGLGRGVQSLAVGVQVGDVRLVVA
jgi:hypothetical protein